MGHLTVRLRREGSVTASDPSQPDEFGVIPEDEGLDTDLMIRGRDEVEDTWSILIGNGRQVMGFEDWLNASPLNWLQFWTNNSSPPRYRFQEPSRLIHNFLASATTLVDHTRNHVRGVYAGHTFRRQYEDAVGTLTKDPLVPFVHDLRNFNLHHSLPLGTATLHLDANDPRPHTFLLKKTRLLQRFDWKEASRTFLGNQEEEFAIVPVIARYMELVNAFHHWRVAQEEALFRRAMEAQHGPNSRIARSI